MKPLIAGLLIAFVLTSVPVSLFANTGPTPLTEAQQEKVAELEAAFEANQNHPFARLWAIFSRFTVTGFIVDTVWRSFRNYEEAQRTREGNQRKYETVRDIVKPEGYKPKPTPAPATPTPTKGTSGSSVQGTGSSGSSGPSSSGSSGSSSGGKTLPEEEEDDSVKTKTGSAAITAFSDGMMSWMRSLFGN